MTQAQQAATANYLDAPRLDGRGFVVLGAGQGIGRQTCHALSQAGGRVLCVDRDAELAAAIAREIGGEPWRADVTLRDDVEATFAKAKELFGGSVSGLVDIVGLADIRPLTAIDDAGWDRNFDMVLRHAYLAIQAGSRVMDYGGTMVFVSSMSGTVSVENQGAYGVAKAALNHLVHCAAHELGPRNIRVNAVAPGFVRTPRLLAALNEDFWTMLNSHIPLRRAAEPSDIAKAILFLASDMSTCITGTVLPIDGGMVVKAALPPIPLGPAKKNKE